VLGYELEDFAAECRTLLNQEPGPAGREKVVELLEDVLKDSEFVERHLGDGTGSRDVLYEDPDLGFTVLAHAYEGASQSNPHDHGPSWAIYGQARGETEMTEWQLVEPAAEDRPGKVRRVKTYPLKPGMACLYNEGQLHSPRREGATRLIRIEGMNMDRVKRLRYEAVE
jgi:predicted metal-dependent enzyme (double-stranded beta helix superfamily)